ncbi:MAG: trimethylamine methyltransferase family protein, partial [Candidatus Hadarchaeum sp.]
KIINREKRETWEKFGAKDLREISRSEIKKILREHQPEPLDPAVEAELKKIIEEIEKRSRGNV